MKITVIIEDRSYNGELTGKHGLSLLLQTENGCVLLDAGSDESTYKNYKSLGFGTDIIDAIVVSHNHYDHIGGIPLFLENCDSKVYISADAENEYYKKRFMHRRKTLSRTEILRKDRDRFVFVDDQTEILPGVFVCRIKDPDKAFFCKDHRLKRLIGNRPAPDDFTHEVYIAVIEDASCGIISSCSHNGIVNIINDAKRRFPDAAFDYFVGGLHMFGKDSASMNCTEKQARKVFASVEKSGLKKIYTGHCTGEKAYGVLTENTNIGSEYFSTGDSFVL